MVRRIMGCRLGAESRSERRIACFARLARLLDPEAGPEIARIAASMPREDVRRAVEGLHECIALVTAIPPNGFVALAGPGARPGCGPGSRLCRHTGNSSRRGLRFPARRCDGGGGGGLGDRCCVRPGRTTARSVMVTGVGSPTGKTSKIRARAGSSGSRATSHTIFAGSAASCRSKHDQIPARAGLDRGGR